MFLLIPYYLEEKSRSTAPMITIYLPHFFLGVLFCDLDHAEVGSYIDKVRKLNLWYKIPINSFLLFLFFTYGSVIPEYCFRYLDPED